MDKGGKGFSLPKSSLKSTKNGKDDSSTKPKGTRKVQFNNEGTPEQIFDFSSTSNGKSGASADKGGKGSTKMNGKASKSKETQPLELRIDPELLKNAKCIMDCEAAEILQGVQDQMILLSRDPTIKLPVSFDRGMMHAQANARYSNPKSVRRVLEYPSHDPEKAWRPGRRGITLQLFPVGSLILQSMGRHSALNLLFYITWLQISVIANVCPESAEEVFALVPSLKVLDELGAFCGKKKTTKKRGGMGICSDLHCVLQLYVRSVILSVAVYVHIPNHGPGTSSVFCL
ncbi:DNA-directed RNA polymerases IV and V subunit 4 [Linum perenne]